MSAALYSFGIFNRTLTADELRIVENCMYAEWICMTGKLEDIEYYDILDARFRSNEEDADRRNKWVGRLGKLHMTLNNYAYSQMSGWNGSENLKNWSVAGSTASILGEYVAHITRIGLSVQIYRTAAAGDSVRMKFRLKGMQPGFRFAIVECNNGSALREMTFATKDMTIDYSGTVSNADSNQIAFFLHASGTVYDLSSNPVIIELLPDYGGALVSDGVDDYAVSDEVIDEEIGGMVCHVGYLNNTLAYTYGLAVVSSVQNNRLYLQRAQSGTVYIGFPLGAYAGAFPLLPALDRTPVAPAAKLYVGGSENTRGKCALYQLRLIKNQPTDVQLEAIKWQCRKEHDDYLIHRGWKEVE